MDKANMAIGRTKPSLRNLRKMGMRLMYATPVGVLLLVAILLQTELIALTTGRVFDNLVQLGLLQPLCAAGIACAIIVGTWATKGSFANEQRKGVKSASSSTIAVQLWAVCFTLIVSAMLLSSFLAGVQHSPVISDTPKYAIKTGGMVKPIEAMPTTAAATP